MCVKTKLNKANLMPATNSEAKPSMLLLYTLIDSIDFVYSKRGNDCLFIYTELEPCKNNFIMVLTMRQVLPMLSVSTSNKEAIK